MHLQDHWYIVPLCQPYQRRISNNSTLVEGGVMVDNVGPKRGDFLPKLDQVFCTPNELVKSIFRVASAAIFKCLQVDILAELFLQQRKVRRRSPMQTGRRTVKE